MDDYGVEVKDYSKKNVSAESKSTAGATPEDV